MNDQINGVLRALVPAALAYAVAKGWLPEGVDAASAEILTAILAVGAAVWSVLKNRPSQKVADVAAMAGTKVEPAAGGKAVIRVVDHDLAKAAKEAATPVSG